MQSQVEGRVSLDMVKIVSILSYLTVIGWIIALTLYGENKSTLARFHLRQSLGLILTGAVLLCIPLIGWGLFVGVILAWGVGLYTAISGQQIQVPLLGHFFQKHLDIIQ